MSIDTKNIDLINIGLMLISCIVAYIVPFELFLFSYAVLGPLHYLTEISWLHKRNYFSQGKYDFIYLAILAVLITFTSFFAAKIFSRFLAAKFVGTIPTLILIAFISSIALAFVKKKSYRYMSIVLIIIACVFLLKVDFYKIFASIFLPTLVHVYLFTGAFILFGALKNKSYAGIISLVVFVVCTVSFFVYVPAIANYNLNTDMKVRYVDMMPLNYELINLLGLDKLNGLFEKSSITSIFHSETGYMVMRFIAFAYTYHYLNWFSKTSVIKWHEVPRMQLVSVLILWIISVAIYFYDYGLGLRCLYLLSLLHVFLEFPLNYHTFKGITHELKTLSIVK